MHINKYENNNIINADFEKNSVNFRANPLILNPTKITDKSFKILGVATSALVTAAIAMNKKADSNKLPTWEELESKLQTMMKPENGKPRFDSFCFSELSRAYKKNPELTLKLINLKQQNKWYISSGSDIYYTVENYEKHPEFTDYLIEQIESGLKGWSTKIIPFLQAKSTNQELLLRLLNYKDKEGNLKIHGCHADKIISFYEEYPEVGEKILSQKNATGDDHIWVNEDIDCLINSYRKYPEIVTELMEQKDINDEKLNGFSISQMTLFDKEKRDYCIDMLKKYNFTVSTVEKIYDSDIPNEFFAELTNLENYKGEQIIDNSTAKNLTELSFEQVKIYTELASRGIKQDTALDLAKRRDASKIQHLFELGFNQEEILDILTETGKYEEAVKEIEDNPGSMRKFLDSSDFLKKLKENSAGKYQKELLEIFNPSTMAYITREQLIKSGLSEEDFLNSLKKISKSCFKLAYDTPNQYLADIDIKFSNQINGHYVELPPKELEFERQKIVQFFIENIGNISRILKYIDNDTFNHLMDKRTALFQENLDILNSLPNEQLEKLSILLNCKSKKNKTNLTPKEKIQLCQIFPIFHSCKINQNVIDMAIKEKEVDINTLKDTIYQQVLNNAGVNIPIKEIKPENRLNSEYAYLALRPSAFSLIPEKEKQETKKQIVEQINLWRKDLSVLEESIQEIENTLISSERDYTFSKKLKESQKKTLEMLKNIDNYSDKELFEHQWKEFEIATNMYSGEEELFDTIKATSLGIFKEYINNPNNKYGQTNAKTKNLFIEHGLNYQEWLDPNVPELKLNIAGKNMTLKFWERNPREDLFMGNKTTCCTGLSRVNGGSTPIYLLSTCWNVIQLYDENNNVVGMSRVFVGNTDNEDAIFMDNIELNNNYVKSMNNSHKKELRDGFFKYIKEYAKKVTGKNNAKVYFYFRDVHVPTEDLEMISKKVDFLGFIPTQKVYINSANCTWINPKEFKENKHNWLKVL